jgi:hypothetical protein
MHSSARIALLLGCTLWSAGCARPRQLPVLAIRTPAPNAQTSEPATPGAPASPLPTAVCTNEAVYLEDLTIPDGTVVSPGQRLDKRWAVRNTGTCNWNAAYRLVPLGESEFLAPEAVALYPARAGEVATLQVVLDAPQNSGEYASRWQPQAPDGSLFGDPVFVFVLVEQPTPTPEPTPIPGG